MNRNHLALFQAVAESGGFSRAAEKLLISQPGISLQVGELESALGLRLFERLPRGVRLTEAGELLLGYARRIAMLEADAEQALRELQGLKRGRLHIGASLTIGSYLLPAALQQFKQQHPEIELSMEIANTEQIHEGIADGRWALGFTEGLTQHEELITESFAEDEMVPIAPPGHPLLAHKNVTAHMLAAEPLLLRETGSGSRAVVEQALARLSIHVRPAAALGSSEAIKAAVIAGMGLAIVSAMTIVNELKAGTLVQVPMRDLQIRRSLNTVTRRNATPSAAVRELLRVISESVSAPRRPAAPTTAPADATAASQARKAGKAKPVPGRLKSPKR